MFDSFRWSMTILSVCGVHFMERHCTTSDVKRTRYNLYLWHAPWHHTAVCMRACVCLWTRTCLSIFPQFPLGQIRLVGAHVEELISHEDSKSAGQSSISIQILNMSPTYLHIDSRHEKVSTQGAITKLAWPDLVSVILFVKGLKLLLYRHMYRYESTSKTRDKNKNNFSFSCSK